MTNDLIRQVEQALAPFSAWRKIPRIVVDPITVDDTTIEDEHDEKMEAHTKIQSERED